MSTPLQDTPSATDEAATASTLHEDPITGEPGAHPAVVGVGALSAGAAGAAIGAVVGPIGMVVGAAIGAVMGGIAGHEAVVTDAETAAASAEPDEDEEKESEDHEDENLPVSSTAEAPELPSAKADLDEPTFSMNDDPEEPVRLAAYYLYLDRVHSGRQGDAVGDWYEALGSERATI